ncbi:MAG TPA: hypothetical protein VGR28_01405 [Candidatus Thermoplasmatota archaeon]|nr:hypothetical protein [Candidatus Thermoplasmatota archaeon]
MALAPDIVVYMAGALLMVGLAALLFALNFNAAPNRAFGLFLALRGLSLLTFGIGAIGAETLEARLWWRLYPYFLIPLPLVAVGFALVYPRPRLGSRTTRAALVALAVAVGGLEAWYVADHDAFWVLEDVPVGSIPFGAAAITGVPLIIPAGPLFLTYGLLILALAAVALVLARHVARAPADPRSRSTLLVSLGFAVFAGYDSVYNVLSSLPSTRTTDPALDAALLAVQAVAVVLVALTAAVLVRHARAGSPIATPVRRYLALLAIATASGLLLSGEALRGFLVAGIWRFALPALGTYALLRHQLFGIDLKIKWTIKQSTVAGMFIGVFFIVSEGAQQVFSASIGPVLGIVAAGALLFALAPLQHAAERVANTAMPTTRSVGEMTAQDKLDLYREQARAAWADGTLTADERRLLEIARQRLGLSRDQAGRIEDDVQPSPT